MQFKILLSTFTTSGKKRYAITSIKTFYKNIYFLSHFFSLSDNLSPIIHLAKYLTNVKKYVIQKKESNERARIKTRYT